MTDIIRIANIDSYTLEIINGDLILTPKENYITEYEFSRSELQFSKISDCIVMNGEVIISKSTKYMSILKDIWISMPTQRILQTTNFNIKLSKQDGYRYCKKLKLFIQYKDATDTMKEIINMIKVNNYSIKICITLGTGQIIKYKLNI